MLYPAKSTSLLPSPLGVKMLGNWVELMLRASVTSHIQPFLSTNCMVKSLFESPYANWLVLKMFRRLHAENHTDNIETEYEQRFSAMGVPINYCKAYL